MFTFISLCHCGEEQVGLVFSLRMMLSGLDQIFFTFSLSLRATLGRGDVIFSFYKC